jgi:glutamine amidotransferase
MLAEVAPFLRGFLLGDTDSEVLFFIFLTQLSREVELHRHGAALDAVVRALRNAIGIVRSISIGHDPTAVPLLTVVVTDGELMVGHQGGKELLFSTHKQLCPERETCRFFAAECEKSPTIGGYVNHLILSSEQLQGENVWTPLRQGEMVAVDHFMRFHHYPSMPSA